jgi:PD-(D/E)XK endonuclease
MAPLKTKGDLAELKVTCDLVERGYRVAIPFGEDCDFDLVAWQDPTKLQRVQVKYTRSDGDRLFAQCRSHSLTNGKVRRTKHYTSATIDWLAVYDATSGRCYYIPAEELGAGRTYLTLRLAPPRNNQRIGIRYAADYTDPVIRTPCFEVEPAGLEPAASRMQTGRSPN